MCIVILITVWEKNAIQPCLIFVSFYRDYGYVTRARETGFLRKEKNDINYNQRARTK